MELGADPVMAVQAGGSAVLFSAVFAWAKTQRWLSRRLHGAVAVSITAALGTAVSMQAADARLFHAISASCTGALIAMFTHRAVTGRPSKRTAP